MINLTEVIVLKTNHLYQDILNKYTFSTHQKSKRGYKNKFLINFLLFCSCSCIIVSVSPFGFEDLQCFFLEYLSVAALDWTLENYQWK